MSEAKKNIKNTALNLFAPGKPHAGQMQVLKALDGGTRWVLLRAGRKWRKTSLIISWLMENAIRKRLPCPFIAPNKVQAKNIVWNDHIQRILNHFKDIGFPYKTNENELIVSFPAIVRKSNHKPVEFGEVVKPGEEVFFDFSKGGKIQLFGVENADSLRGISNWGAVGADEYDDWEEDIWPLVIRPNLITHHAPALIAGTPKGYKNIYRLAHPLDGSKSIFKEFHFSSYDNPELSRDELKEMEAEYRSMGEGFYRQEILAVYERPYGTVYEEWPESNWTEFGYDPFLPVHLAIDFGVNDPTAIIWIQPNGGEFRVIDYYQTSDASVEHFAQIIHSKPYRKPSLVVGDAAGKARSITTNTSPIDEYAKHGIFIRTKDGLQIQDQVRITHKYIPSLYIAKGKADQLRDCLLNYSYPKKRETAVNQSNEVPIHDQWSHGARALEYYFANIDSGGLFKNYSGIAAKNKSLGKKWSIG